MNAIPTLLIWIILGLLVYWLTTAVFSILAARIHFEVSRHNLLVRSKQMRNDYLSTLNERMAGVIDDEDTQDVIVEEPDEKPMKLAA